MLRETAEQNSYKHLSSVYYMHFICVLYIYWLISYFIDGELET